MLWLAVKDAISLDKSLIDKTNTTANSIAPALELRYNVLLTCSCEHRMMIHEYHKIVGKTKTRQELRLKNKNRVSLYIFTSPWIL